MRNAVAHLEVKMSRLHDLEMEILQLHNGLSLRPTLDTVARIGEKLQQAKELVPHGQWIAWLCRCRIKPRMAQLMMQVSREDPPEGAMGLDRFLRTIRIAKRAIAHEALDARQEAARGKMPPGCRVVRADCRRYNWPRPIDVIGTDPPWSDMDCYQWLGEFASSHLKPGGLLLCQGSQLKMMRQIQLLCAAGMQYRWTLAIVHESMQNTSSYHPFAHVWSPLFVLSKGRMDRNLFPSFSDVFTVEPWTRRWHPWEQALTPWVYWLGKLTLPGQLIVDPFCCSATVGVALRDIGQRQYLGTDIDPKNVRIARTRLMES
jgi:hypothetical protein